MDGDDGWQDSNLLIVPDNDPDLQAAIVVSLSVDNSTLRQYGNIRQSHQNGSGVINPQIGER